jgi:hypothetical protein
LGEELLSRAALAAPKLHRRFSLMSSPQRRNVHMTTDNAAYRSGFGFLVADAIACEGGLGIVGGMGCYRQESSFRRVAEPVG